VDPDAALVMELLRDLSRAPRLLPASADGCTAAVSASGDGGGDGSGGGGDGGEDGLCNVWLLSSEVDAPTNMTLAEVRANFTPKPSQNRHEDGSLGPLRQARLGEVHAVVAPKLLFAQYSLLAAKAPRPAATGSGGSTPEADTGSHTGYDYILPKPRRPLRVPTPKLPPPVVGLVRITETDDGIDAVGFASLSLSDIDFEMLLLLQLV
jgi:hypothetical protein